MRQQHGEDDWPGDGGVVPSNLVIKIKEKKKRVRRNKPELFYKNKLCGQNHKSNDQQTMPYNMNKKSKGKKKCGVTILLTPRSTHALV